MMEATVEEPLAELPAVHAAGEPAVMGRGNNLSEDGTRSLGGADAMHLLHTLVLLYASETCGQFLAYLRGMISTEH